MSSSPAPPQKRKAGVPMTGTKKKKLDKTNRKRSKWLDDGPNQIRLAKAVRCYIDGGHGLLSVICTTFDIPARTIRRHASDEASPVYAGPKKVLSAELEEPDPHTAALLIRLKKQDVLIRKLQLQLVDASEKVRSLQACCHAQMLPSINAFQLEAELGGDMSDSTVLLDPTRLVL